MTDLKSYPHPVGIKNNGLNNCYYNSIIQCFCQTNTLITLLIEENQKSKLGLMNSIGPQGSQKTTYKSPPLGKISQELLQLLISYQIAGDKNASSKNKKTKEIITNHNLLKIVGEKSEKFAVGKQASCITFFKILFSLVDQENLDAHKDSIKNSINFQHSDNLSESNIDSVHISPINKVFGGRSLNCLRCKKCGLLNKVENNFNSLPLNVHHLIQNTIDEKSLSKNKQKKLQKQKLRQKTKEKRKNVSNTESNNQKVETIYFDNNESLENFHTSLEIWYNNDNRINGPLVHSKKFDDLPKTLRMESLTMIKENSLIRVLANNFRTQTLATNCEKCSKAENTEHEFKNLISLPPPVLMFEFNIFKANTAKEIKKLNIHVDLPPLLDISPYCIDDVKEYADSKGRIVYELFAIICHHGNTTASGHYNSFVKRRKGISKLAQLLIGDIPQETSQSYEVGEGDWYQLNDSEVIKTNFQEVCSKDAYVCFYEKVV